MNNEREVFVFTEEGNMKKMVTSNDKVLVIGKEVSDLPDYGEVGSGKYNRFRSYDVEVTPLDVKTLTVYNSVPDTPLEDINPEELSKVLTKSLPHGKVVKSFKSLHEMCTTYVMEMSYAIHPDNPLSDIISNYEKQAKEYDTNRAKLVKAEGEVKNKISEVYELRKENSELENRFRELNTSVNNPKITMLMFMAWFWITNLFKK